MEYSVGSIGRVFLLKFAQDEDFLHELEALCVSESVRSAIFYIIGGINSADIVSGPALETLPPIPILRSIDKKSEILGIGTVFPADGRPKIHLHAAVAKGDGLQMGCIRDNARTFLISEVVMLEIDGIDAKRVHDPQSGFNLLKIFDAR